MELGLRDRVTRITLESGRSTRGRAGRRRLSVASGNRRAGQSHNGLTHVNSESGEHPPHESPSPPVGRMGSR
jgi:hypothetical protein